MLKKLKQILIKRALVPIAVFIVTVAVFSFLAQKFFDSFDSLNIKVLGELSGEMHEIGFIEQYDVEKIDSYEKEIRVFLKLTIAEKVKPERQYNRYHATLYINETAVSSFLIDQKNSTANVVAFITKEALSKEDRIRINDEIDDLHAYRLLWVLLLVIGFVCLLFFMTRPIWNNDFYDEDVKALEKGQRGKCAET
ncbi:MAG: hypothetical protein ACYTFY_17470 [Planctomycetota bacterium]